MIRLNIFPEIPPISLLIIAEPRGGLSAEITLKFRGSDHGCPLDFFQGWTYYGSRNESLPAGSRDGTPVEVLGAMQVVKIMHKLALYGSY